jgi:hypothetical protein
VTAQPEVTPGAEDLVGIVQRFGLSSAAAVVDRYLQIVDRAITGDTLTPPSRTGDGGPGPMLDLATPMAEAWARVLGTSADLLRIRTGDAPETLDLPAVAPGGSAEGSLWLHNTTSSAVPAAQLHVTGLASPEGHRIADDAVTLVPDRVGLLAPGNSREVRLRVVLPPDQPAAHYHGLVLTSAAPEEPLVVRLDVR